jgi:hypothetical protein
MLWFLFLGSLYTASAVFADLNNRQATAVSSVATTAFPVIYVANGLVDCGGPVEADICSTTLTVPPAASAVTWTMNMETSLTITGTAEVT